MSAAALTGLSASVTRILSLTGFPKELKTKDIQTAFAEWDQVNGGFKIKWKDDTSLYIVFQDPGVAKRAYLKALATPPATLTNSATGVKASIVPYNGSEAQSVIAAVQSRTGHGPNASRSGQSGRSQSISGFPTHRSSFSRAEGSSITPPPAINTSDVNLANGHAISNIGRESPTLPNLPTHPSLNDLINSASNSPQQEQPAFFSGASLSGAPGPATPPTPSSHPPRIGDPGKRMVGAALGVRHPALGPRVISGNTSLGLDRPMGALSLND